MNIYIFYKKSDRYFDTNRVTIYAYTDDKGLAKEFKKQRNMDIFIYTKEDITKKEFIKFEYRWSKHKLSYGSFYTKSDEFGKRIGVKVVCTWEEEDSILKNSDRLWEEFAPALFDTRMFKSEYLILLEKLLFLKFYGFYKITYPKYADNFYYPYYNSYGPVEDMIVDEALSDLESSYSYDELKLFLRFFKNTFVKEDEEEDLL